MGQASSASSGSASHDNFFDLGGHSLLSAQVTFQIAEATGYRLSPRALVFQNLEQIAAELPVRTAPSAEQASAPPDHRASTAAAGPGPSPGAAPRPAASPSTPPADKPLVRKLLDRLKGRLR